MAKNAFFSDMCGFNALNDTMNKIKPLLPSLREKKRYLVFEISFGGSNDSVFKIGSITDVIQDAFLSLFGNIGLSNAGLMILKDKWDDKMRKGIIKVNHKYVNALKASLTFVTQINGEQVMLRSVGTSGGLKKAQKKYIAA